MVWDAVSKRGKLPLVFIEKGAKVNTTYYQQEILESNLKMSAPVTQGDDNWCFQQDSAPAHKAKTTQAWCRAKCPDFISEQEWPPSSPDLNPLDFCVWGILEAKVNEKPHRSLEPLKKKLLTEWDRLPMKTIRAAIDAWPTRLARVVQRKGNRIE